MKKDVRTIERFVELRAQGLSFQKVADELGIRKQTAINWSKQYAERLESAQAEAFEALQKKLGLTLEKRTEVFAGKINAIVAELDKRIEGGEAFENLSTERLFGLLLKLNQTLENILPDLTYYTLEEAKNLECARNESEIMASMKRRVRL